MEDIVEGVDTDIDGFQISLEDLYYLGYQGQL